MSIQSAVEKIDEELNNLPSHQVHPTVMWCINHLAVAAATEIKVLRARLETLEKKDA